MNKLHASLRCETSIDRFKAGLHKWVKTNINVKPKPRFPALVDRPMIGHAEQPRPAAHSPNNLITRYFQPVNQIM